MLKIPGLLLLLAPLATVGAQTRGTVNESRMISQKDGAKPDTMVMRTTSVGARTRVDVTGPGTLVEPWRSMGKTSIMIVTDSGTAVTYVDSARKSYWTMNTRSMFNIIQRTTGLTMQPVEGGERPTLDSVGDGGAVAGYQTIHFRGHSTTRMTMNVLGEPTTWTDVRTTDYYVAAALPSDSLEMSAPSSPKPPRDVATMALSDEMKEMAAQRRATMMRMTKLGATVKTVTDSRMTTTGGARSQIQTTELLSHRTMLVPDSTFVVPVGYTKTFPGFTPTP